jgi:DNA-binding MarR family transcriptional regulator
MAYQTYILLKKCEDHIFEKEGLTMEQFGILVSIGYLGEPTRVTDIARWLERSPNSISMIVDRMVKAGLIKRMRDKRDRREVHVFISSRVEKAPKPATRASLVCIRKILSPLSYEDRRTLFSLLGTIKYGIFRISQS